MKQFYFIIPLLYISHVVAAQPTGQKEFYNKNCKLPNNTNELTVELKSTDVDLSNYLQTNFPEYKLHSPVEFNLLFIPNVQPCFYRTVVLQPDLISKIQKDTLLQRILRFPGFQGLNIKGPKKLFIFVAQDKNFNYKCEFIGKSSERK